MAQTSKPRLNATGTGPLRSAPAHVMVRTAGSSATRAVPMTEQPALLVTRSTAVKTTVPPKLVSFRPVSSIYSFTSQFLLRPLIFPHTDQIIQVQQLITTIPGDTGDVAHTLGDDTHDDYCDKGYIIICPPGAGHNSECHCIKDPGNGHHHHGKDD